MKIFTSLLILFLSISCTKKKAEESSTKTLPAPPFLGTAYVNANIITSDDSTVFLEASYTGTESVSAYDRRTDRWDLMNLHLFDATFSDGLAIVVRVNPELGSSEAAQIHAERFARILGQLPKFLRAEVKTITIHDENHPLGGGAGDILIHLGFADAIGSDLEETIFHEATHVSMDPLLYYDEGYRSARDADSHFISDYAQQFPDREDIAESMLLWFALRYKSNKLTSSEATTIAETIPNRMNYWDSKSYIINP